MEYVDGETLKNMLDRQGPLKSILGRTYRL